MQSDIRNQMIEALKGSLIGDNAMLQKSSEKLSQLAKVEGYCMQLMKIIDEPTFDLALKQAALVQLKNNIKSKWKPKNEKLELSATEKHHIRNAIILAVIRCAKSYMLIKLYREVLTTIIGNEFETWIPTQDLITLLNNNESGNLAPVLQCIIAISTNFEFSVIEKQKIFFNQFLKQMLPAVFKTVKTNINNPEIIYLALKILWKAVHYQINNQIKVLTNEWMELIYLTISAVNQDMQKILDEYQAKNTPEFYYYHSKKWATRILMRYVQKHAKAFSFGKISQENIQYSNFWYENYGIKLCESIVVHLSTPVPTTKKIRYFQLKIIQGIISDKPELISQHASHFQYNVLLKYMIVTPEDEKLAQQDVVQYLRVDDESSMTYSNIKKVATQVWNCFMQLNSKLDRDQNTYQPGPLFEDSVKFMYEKIMSENLIEKELGMYLFCDNRITINRVPIIKQKVPQILQKFVIPQLVNPALLIRARAHDMFFQYGRDIKDASIMSKAIEGIYKCLVNDECPLVRIKAAIALNPLVSHPQCKKLLEPYLKNILEVYLKLIEKYDLEQVVSALQFFIGDYADSIGPFAVDLFKYLYGIFIKMFNKDIELSQNQDYGSEVQMAASGCIKTMSQIIESPLDQQVRQQIEPCLLDLCAFLFMNASDQYHEDMMYLMRVHLDKIDKISPQCWFFYQVIIYYISGIPNELWNQIQNLPLSDVNKQILSAIREGNNIQFLSFAIPVVRNYFGKGYSMIVTQKDEFKNNFINMLFHLVGQVYRKGNANSEIEGQIHLDCCSILLVYLVQTFPPQMTKPVIGSIWNICKFNLIKGTSIYLKSITCQIIGVLLWKHTIDFLQILSKEKHVKAVMKHLELTVPRLEQVQQRKRIIFGICSVLRIVDKDLQLLGPFVPLLFKMLLRSVKKNCFTRIILNTKDQALRKQFINLSDNDSDDNTQNQDIDEDDEDLWDEQYYDKHVSMLKKVNELAYFQQTIQVISNQSKNVYQAMIGSVTNQKLLQIQNLLQKAITLPEK